MKVRNALIVILIALILGFIVLWSQANKHFQTQSPGEVDSVDSYVLDSQDETPVPTSADSEIAEEPISEEESVIPTVENPISFLQNEEIDDVADVLLLYDSHLPTSYDKTFCHLAEFLGLGCKQLDILNDPLTKELLQDENGEPYKLIGVSAVTFLKVPQLLTYEELEILKTALYSGESTLHIGNVDGRMNTYLLSDLTDGAVSGARYPLEPPLGWTFSETMPAVTREFTGQTIESPPITTWGDSPIEVVDPNTVTTLMSAYTASGDTYPVFVLWESGEGRIFIDGGWQRRYMGELRLREMYYDVQYSSYILPMMMVYKNVMQDEAWHRSTDYANLTLDDPVLVEPFFQLSYPSLLREMELHNFHTTISLVPAQWEDYDNEVVTLFKRYPNRLSIVQQGNNGDGYEFYKYVLDEDDSVDDPNLSARPLSEQEADIQEGLLRLNDMNATLQLPFDRIMVFPSGIAPTKTLELLKKYNYLGTVNAQPAPLGEAMPTDNWGFGMYPAELSFGNFPLLTNRHPGTYMPFVPNIQPSLFDLFIDKPALFYSFAYEEDLFADGITAFNEMADIVNALSTNVEWHSLGYILKHLYLEKQNDDGSTSIFMYTNVLEITNESDASKVYHIQKEETLNVPILSVTVNGESYPYQIVEGWLRIALDVPAQASFEIVIQYGE